jgi:long-chain acyl-CoA synthetase
MTQSMISNKQNTIGNTWPKLLRQNFESRANKKAMRYKAFGIWHSYTWKDYYINVKNLAQGLLSLGFKTGDKLLVIGDTAPHFYFSLLAAQANRGVCVGIYPDANVREVKYFVNDCQARFLIAQDQEQVDKLLEIEAEIPTLTKIIYWNYKGLAHYKNPKLMGYREVIKLGEEFGQKNPDIFDNNVESGKPEDTYCIMFTSGTESLPVGSKHTYESSMANVNHLLELDTWKPTDNVALQSPPVGYMEHWIGIGCHLISGSIMNFPENPLTQQLDFREIAPTVIGYSPRFWENQVLMINSRMSDADAMSRYFWRSMSACSKIADMRFQNKKPGLFQNITYFTANLLILRKIKDSLGLTKARICYSTGQTVNTDTIRFFSSLKVPLKNIYGCVEGGIVAGPKTADIRPETVGSVFKGVELKVGENGELVWRQNGIFAGYNRQEESKSSKMKDGWFHSGDVGSFTKDGQLIFQGRLKDVCRISDKDYFFPDLMENRLKSSPYIRNAWTIVDNKNTFVSAVVNIDYDKVGKWAGHKRLVYTNYAELSQKPEVLELIKKEIERVNTDLPECLQVKKFVSLSREFSAEESELTRDRKLKRLILKTRYEQLIKSINENKDDFAIETSVKHRDGRIEIISNKILIRPV